MSESLLPWYWRSLPLAGRTGSDIFARLFLQEPGMAVLLESPYPTPADFSQLSRYSLCAGAPRRLGGKTQLWTPPIGEILPLLAQLERRGQNTNVDAPEDLPFTGGWLGWLGYDLAWEIERLPTHNRDPLPFPVACWYEPAAFAVLDHAKQVLWLATTVSEELDKLEAQLDVDYSPLLTNTATSSPSNLSFLSSRSDYQQAVRRAKEYIQAGDIFQANLSLRFQSTINVDSWSIYRRLQAINPSPFACYWQSPWGVLISCSPERLVQLQGNIAQTRPIAGTRPRGKTPQEEQQLAEELMTSTKERAEHIMLVDLERNDLGRVCEWGSVVVDELLVVERYSHVMHLVSNVRGTLRSHNNTVDLIRALFPGGTITGCPKVRCLEIIEELEPVRRNLFYGSCGYLDWRGNLDLNILIRTLLLAQEDKAIPHYRVWGQVGAGIVADSDPESEWRESLHKAEAQFVALSEIF
ncbi:MAG: anthranilate synthase component I [Microcystis panniformis]